MQIYSKCKNTLLKCKKIKSKCKNNKSINENGKSIKHLNSVKRYLFAIRQVLRVTSEWVRRKTGVIIDLSLRTSRYKRVQKKADSLQDELTAIKESEDTLMKKENSNSKQQTPNESKAWFITMHIASMKKTGLTEKQYMDPPTIAKFIKDTWENSGKDREAGVVVCMSADGKYHLHGGLYGNTTTFKTVKDVMFDCHIEEQKATKKKLTDYLRKNPPYDEKGETVLYELGLECIKDVQGRRAVFEEIDDMLAQGMTPSEIIKRGMRYRRFEKSIKSAYLDRRIEEAPIVKDMHVEYHFGPARSGKTYTYVKLCEQYSRKNIYMVNDYDNGGFDKYLELDAPPILFLDELKGVGMSYGQLLSVLDVYSDKQTHSRYTNTYNLWTGVYMTSVFSIEELYQIMVDYHIRKTDGIEQLLERINTIVYHYKENGEYKTFSMPASEYKDYNDMMARLHKATDSSESITF